MRCSFCLILIAVISCSQVWAADAFDLHTSEYLASGIAKHKARTSLSQKDAGRLKTLSDESSSPCIVVKTDDGNVTKALIAWGFRRGKDKLVPVLIIERYVTYRGGRGDTTSAAGKNVMLFAGFSFNFDIGQVVPDGQGGDLRFTAKGDIEPLGKAKLYGLDGSQIPKNSTAVRSGNHDGVLPADFAGTWNVSVDGRWKGELRLERVTGGKLRGKYTSADSKSTYNVTGRIAGLPHHAKLTIHLDNARQTIDAFLFTKDKSAMAGSSVLAGREFGFHAIRPVRRVNSKRK